MANDQSFIEGLGQNAATQTSGGIIGAGMGLILEGHNNRRQIRQQQKLTDMQLAANNQMGEYNYERQMKLWHETNYGPQMKELKKAGLNPGLIYGMGGGTGGTTAATPAQGTSGSHAPTGGGEAMGLMMQQMQLGLMEAQRENIQADTENKKADTTNKPIMGENIKASTASITQGITNQQTQNALMQAQKLATETNIENTQTQTKLIEDQIQLMDRDIEVNNATKEDKILQIKQEAINAIILGEVMKQGIQVDKAAIQKMAADIAQGWQNLDIQSKRQIIEQKMLENNIEYAPVDRIIKGVDIISNGLIMNKIMKTNTPTVNKIGFNANKKY